MGQEELSTSLLALEAPGQNIPDRTHPELRQRSGQAGWPLITASHKFKWGQAEMLGKGWLHQGDLLLFCHYAAI